MSLDISREGTMEQKILRIFNIFFAQKTSIRDSHTPFAQVVNGENLILHKEPEEDINFRNQQLIPNTRPKRGQKKGSCQQVESMRDGKKSRGRTTPHQRVFSMER